MAKHRVGPAVKVVRTRFNIMQYKLQVKLGWSISTMYQVEQGNRSVTPAMRDAIVSAIAELAKRPIEDIAAMIEEEENRR